MPHFATRTQMVEIVRKYMMAGTNVLSEELNSIEDKAEDYLENYKDKAAELMKKQTNLVKKAIQLAQRRGYPYCVESTYSPSSIIDSEFEAIEDCKDVEGRVNRFLDVLENVLKIIEEIFTDVEETVSNCGVSYQIPKTKICVDEAAERYKNRLLETYDSNLEVLRKKFNVLSERTDSDMLVCIVEARGNVLNLSRLGAARIYACMSGEEIPQSAPKPPPIEFLKFPQPTTAHLRLAEVFDENGYD